MNKDELNQYNVLVRQFALAYVTNTHSLKTVEQILDLAEDMAMGLLTREKNRRADNE